MSERTLAELIDSKGSENFERCKKEKEEDGKDPRDLPTFNSFGKAIDELLNLNKKGGK